MGSIPIPSSLLFLLHLFFGFFFIGRKLTVLELSRQVILSVTPLFMLLFLIVWFDRIVWVTLNNFMLYDIMSCNWELF